MKRPFLAVLVILLPFSLFSQTKDFGIWYEAGASIPITRYLDFNLGGEIRTFEDASKINESFGEIGLSLKLLKWLSVAGNYRLTSKIEHQAGYFLRHKFMADIKGKTNIGRFGLYCRFRFQDQIRTYIKNPTDEDPDYYGRVKLEINYNIPKSHFEPVLYYEQFARMFRSTEKTFDKYRLSAGLNYRISKKHRVGVAYIFQRSYLPRLADINILAVSYDFKL